MLTGAIKPSFLIHWDIFLKRQLFERVYNLVSSYAITKLTNIVRKLIRKVGPKKPRPRRVRKPVRESIKGVQSIVFILS